MIYKAIDCSPENLLRYQRLFDATFGVQAKFQPKSLEWLYAKNPDGRVFGFDAYDGDVLAAHYACIPTEIWYEGRVERALLSLNTATHPNYQGKGLFVKLAEMTYLAAEEAGFSFVYGVANSNSTPGFLRRLGFVLLEPLRVRLVGGRLKHNVEGVKTVAQFSRAWNAESLAWRFANPESPLSCHESRHGVIVSGRSKWGWLPVEARLPCVDGLSFGTRIVESPIRLFLGLIPDSQDRGGLYFDIPDNLKPSPLNFIYKDLTGKGRIIRKGEVFFTFVDFDAY